MSKMQSSFLLRHSGILEGKDLQLHGQLFQLLLQSKQPITDEEWCRNKLNVQSKSQFARIKAKLLNMLLLSVRQHYLAQNSTGFLKVQIALLHFLHQHNLTLLADKTCQEALKYAQEINDFQSHFQLLILHYEITGSTQNRDLLLNRNHLNQQLEEDLAKITFLNEQTLVFENLKHLYATSQVRLDVHAIAEVEGFKKSLSQLPLWSDALPLILYHVNHLLYHALLHEGHKAAQHAEALLGFWSKACILMDEQPNLLLMSLNVSLYNAFTLHDCPQAMGLLRNYESILQQRPHPIFNFQAPFALISFNTRIKLSHKYGYYDEVEKLLNAEAPAIVRQVQQLNNPSKEINVLSTIAISYFVLERWQEAEEVILEIKEMNRHANREDVLYLSMLFHLIILYERKQWYYLDRSADAAYHFLYSRKKLRPFEKELMLFLKKLTVLRRPKEAKEAMQQFLLKLKEYKTDPVKDLYFLYFNYFGWLESKVMGITYRSYRQQQIESGALS